MSVCVDYVWRVFVVSECAQCVWRVCVVSVYGDCVSECSERCGRFLW